MGIHIFTYEEDIMEVRSDCENLNLNYTPKIKIKRIAEVLLHSNH